MKAIFYSVTKKYERTTNGVKLAGMLGFCFALTIIWFGVLFTSGY